MTVAKAQAVSRRLPKAAVRVRARFMSRGFCVGQSGKRLSSQSVARHAVAANQGASECMTLKMEAISSYETSVPT
jgi:hypothetical protein